ncbi:MAG: type II toxin-antitoxin system RelE/ParE family toxin [Pseudomonadales bacterium]
MQIFLNKAFGNWATKERLTNSMLRNTVQEMEQGLIDADLGGHVFKKRIALGGQGKSGGVRTLLAYKAGDKAFFIYGFAKNVRANIRDDELKALKLYAATLLAYDDNALGKAVQTRTLIKVCDHE